jgi:hypothetical protein
MCGEIFDDCAPDTARAARYQSDWSEINHWLTVFNGSRCPTTGQMHETWPSAFPIR